MNRIGKYEGVVRLVLLLVVLPAAVYRLSLGRTVALWGDVCRAERTLARRRIPLPYNRILLPLCSIRRN